MINASAAAESYGQTETLTATVFSANGTVNDGTVTFYDGNISLGTATVSNGTATLTTMALTAGVNFISSNYLGTLDFAPSSTTTSASVTVTAVPIITVSNDAIPLTNNSGLVNFGTTTLGSPLTQVITVTNSGDSALVVQPVVAPAGFLIVAGTNFTANQSIAAGASASFTLQMNATAVSTPSGVVTINDNDPSTPAFTFNVTGVVNYNAPSDVALTSNTIADSKSVGSTVGTFFSYDADSKYAPQTYTYSLGTGGDNSAFQIVGNQLISAVSLNAFAQTYYHIQITTTDVISGLSFTKPFTVIVTPTANHAPYAITLSNNTISDAQLPGSAVGTLISYDVDTSLTPQAFTYSLGAGGDNAAFTINGNQLVTNASLDAGVQQFYHIQVTSTEVSSGLSYTATLTVIVTPTKGHSPYAVTLTNNTILDNVTVGTAVGRLDSYDVDSSRDPQAFTYSMGTGGDNAVFQISGNELFTNSFAAFDSSVQKYYHIQVTSTEVGSNAPSFTTTLTVIVNPAAIPVVTAISTNTIPDSASVGAVVGTLSSFGEVGPFTYTLGTGGDNSAFQLNGNQLETNVLFNALTQQYYHIQVTALDQGGHSFTTPLTIIVAAGTSHSPYYIGLTSNSISDSAVPNTVIGRLDSYDVDSSFGPQTFTYSLGTGGDNAAFKIVGNQLEVATALDAQTQKFYHIQVSSTEVGSGMAAFTTMLTVIVTPSVTPTHDPYAIAIDNQTISDVATAGTLVGNLQTYDIDSNTGHPTFSYTLGSGDDNSAFAVNGNQLVLGNGITLNASKQTYYHIQVTSTEVGTNNSLTTTVTVIVTHATPPVIPAASIAPANTAVINNNSFVELDSPLDLLNSDNEE
jgi:hypothetical protein